MSKPPSGKRPRVRRVGKLSAREEQELLAHFEFELSEKVFEPQDGPQTLFYDAKADIVLYGGAAGGGKTWALLLENLRHIKNGAFGSVVFRRESTQINVEGGLWDNSKQLYPLRGGKPREHPHFVWKFPSGAKISFRHLQLENDVLGYQGAQIPLICYDELTHFTRSQFIYMLSRNRSTCGVKPYIRATTNPDADSWVARFIEWYIYQDRADEAFGLLQGDEKTMGLAIPERSGVIRYFTVESDEVIWGNSREEVAKKTNKPEEFIKSFTFIASNIFDNKILLKKDPSYLANLHALSAVEKARLLGGNWRIRPSSGLYFKREQAKIVTSPPESIVAICRAWDLAATEETPSNQSPDATAGVLIARLSNGKYCVMDVEHFRLGSDDVRKKVKQCAEVDRGLWPNLIRVRLPQDPGQAGKDQIKSYITMLAGHSIHAVRPTGDKVVRADPFAAQWQANNVYVMQGHWNEKYFTELEGFPDSNHEDMVDASSDAFAEVAICGTPVIQAESVSYAQIMEQSAYGGLFS